MSQEKQHITSYRTYAIMLIVLLLLTALSVFITQVELKTWSVAITLLMAGSMAFILLVYFMHLQFDHILIKILVALIFLLFAVFVGITLLEYATR